MENRFFIDVACKQIFCHGERICGDSFLCRRIEGDRRTIVVLSDGLGHGVKANILSTLTSAMLMNFITAHENITSASQMILKTLPVCSVRKISYSTFTVVDIDSISGEVTIVEYDNPRAVIMRGDEVLKVIWEREEIVNQARTQIIHKTTFSTCVGDRILFVSDGVTQSGQRSGRYKFGWGVENLNQFVNFLVSYNRSISSHDLALQVLSKASQNDDANPSDDISCVALHVRAPRRMMLVSCPPASRQMYGRLLSMIDGFEGVKVLCGYPVAEIIASERGVDIARADFSNDPMTPPTWSMHGFELVTEGIITLNRTLDILEHDNTDQGSGTAEKLCRMLLRSDQINFVIGTKRSIETGQYMPDEFELRRNVLRRIVSLLQAKYNKQISVEYL